MNSRSLLIPATLLAISASFGVSADAGEVASDAQAQAAALLRGSLTSESLNTPKREIDSSASTAVDAHSHAAALMSGKQSGYEPARAVTRSGTTSDAQSQAAALLGGSQSTAHKRVRASATRETVGHHPAVLVAQAWGARAIDPNTFIVGHPAGRQLVAASNVELDRIVRAETGR